MRNVLRTDYPLYSQSDYQILRILEQIKRVLKPSAFCLLWVNKTLLGNDRVPLWLLKTPSLKIVDCLVWHKKNFLGLGNWLRSNAEFCFLIQKSPQKGKVFKNRSFGNVWEENALSASKRKHPHQKPRELTKALIEATTNEGDLIVEPEKYVVDKNKLIITYCNYGNRSSKAASFLRKKGYSQAFVLKGRIYGI